MPPSNKRQFFSTKPKLSTIHIVLDDCGVLSLVYESINTWIFIPNKILDTIAYQNFPLNEVFQIPLSCPPIVITQIIDSEIEKI